ncbi:ABC transporter substrate-binding protein, partial [Burkholderia pseudomallei]
LPIENDETALRMYQAGQIDYTYSSPAGGFGQISKQFGKELRPGLQLATDYYYLKNSDPALKDQRVRDALAMVLDREILTSKI